MKLCASLERRPAGRLCLAVALLLAWACCARADFVRILHCDRDALQARIDLIEQATCEINLATFVVGDDEAPLVVLGALREAARRGVTVRLLVDGRSANRLMPRSLQAHLIREGVQIREYHPPDLHHPNWYKHRLHDKLLVVDCQQLIAGGRNVKNEYFGLDCRNFVDRDVYTRGCAAQASRNYFLARWNSSEVRPADMSKPNEKYHHEMIYPELDASYTESTIDVARAVVDAAMTEAAECGLVKFATGTDWSAGLADLPYVYFWHDFPGEAKNAPGAIADQMLTALANARQSIVLETPYFVISHEMKRVLHEARARGVSVIVLTNSLVTNNQPGAQAAYENQKHWMLAQGIELWELAGCDHLHAKAAVIDGCRAIIGSYNWDLLSEQRNTETAVVVDDGEIAAALLWSIDQHLWHANPIGPDRKPDGFDARYPGATPEQLKELHHKRLLAPFIRCYL